jgi:signal transduction histidine kinase
MLVQDLRDAQRYGELTEEYLSDAVKNAMKHINFMSRTIDDFRDFMKPSRDKAAFNVGICLDEMLFMFVDVFKKDDIAVSIQTADGNAEYAAMGYPNEFKQVILNLMGNSRDAILARRKKTASNKYEPGKIVITLSIDNGKSVITVRDNGGGIHEDIIGRVFDPYFTTKSRDTGTGIGLYMAKSIIEGNMGGTLTAGNVDGGAEFRIEL